jgi:SNF2 family DNA or RNA helicase
VGAGLNAEEVGLGKTVETIGLLLLRSNQRKAAIEQGAQVSKALPTLIVLPQNLVEQWRDEIFEFTDRFTIYMYYGPPRKSVDEKVLYVPKNQTNGRLTRSHKLFSGAEENSDVIILTSYATWTARHGPRVQWDWLCIQRQNQPTESGKPSKKQAEKLLLNEGIAYHSIDTRCPHQLFGLFERIIIDEGHTIRHQSEDIGWAVSNTGSKYRHILSGTPTFDNIEEFAGIMRFLQNPQLSEKKYLLDMGFTEKELVTGTYENRKVSYLESATFWNDPYLLDDSHPRAQLKFTAEAMEKYLFSKGYNQGKGFDTVEQGRRLSQVLKKIMIRRTHSSLLNGVPIGKSLPSVQRMVFECDFTDLEREHYDFMMQDEATTLFKIKKNKNEKSVAWSTTAYRKWCLLASWLGFQYLLDYKASQLSSKRKNMSALSILQDIQKGQDRLKIPKDKQIPLSKNADTENVQKILEQHCTGSPKLRQLLRILAEVVVLREEKALLWVNNPAQAEWLEHVS